jgi:hypothetical protein
MLTMVSEVDIPTRVEKCFFFSCLSNNFVRVNSTVPLHEWVRVCGIKRKYRVRHTNGRLLEELKVRGVFAQVWSPSRGPVQKVISFVVYFKIILL